MRTLTVSVLLLTALLAGCSGAKDPEADDSEPNHEDLAVTTGSKAVVLTLNVTLGNETFRFTGDDVASSLPASSSGSSVTMSSSNSTTSSGPAANTTGATGNATDTPSGPAPLDVTFELGALQLTNKSGLRWTLDSKPTAAAAGTAGNASGNGSASGTKTGMTLPATVESTYNVTGTYQVAYTLKLSNKTVDTLELTLIVSNGTARVQAPQDIPFSVEGSLTVGTQGPDSCGADGSIDVAEHPWDLAAVASITTIVVHMDLGTTNVDSDVFLLDPAGEVLGSSEDFNVLTQSPTEDFTVEGPLGPGIYTFRVTGCTGVQMEYTITATASALV